MKKTARGDAPSGRPDLAEFGDAPCKLGQIGAVTFYYVSAGCQFNGLLRPSPWASTLQDSAPQFIVALRFIAEALSNVGRRRVALDKHQPR
jgi:hypothetical protein